MKIVLGLKLDGIEQPRNAKIGEYWCGPMGFARFLEARLGIGYPSATEAERRDCYLDALKKTDDGMRFYSKSLQRDELSATATLLEWRDQWVSWGWNGKGSCDRTRDLAQWKRTQTKY